MIRLWEDTQDILIDMILNSPELRNIFISRLTKMRENNASIIPEIHLKLDELSKNNSKLFAALKLIPEDPTLVGAIEDYKLEKAELIGLIKDTADAQLKLKYLIKILQNPRRV